MPELSPPPPLPPEGVTPLTLRMQQGPACVLLRGTQMPKVLPCLSCDRWGAWSPKMGRGARTLPMEGVTVRLPC